MRLSHDGANLDFEEIFEEPGLAFRFSEDDETVEAGVRRMAVEMLNKALAEIDDPELDPDATVHQVRKRCKKTRALIRLVRPEFKSYRQENAALRDAAAKLSGNRDAAVMIETYDALMDHYADQAPRKAFGLIRRGLTLRLKALQADAPPVEKLEAFRDRIAAIRMRAEGWRIGKDGFAALRGGLENVYARARKTLKAAEKSPSAENLHEWRKRVKYHGFHCRVLRPTNPEILGMRALEAGNLADLLGLHHDLEVLSAHIAASPASFGGADRVDTFRALARYRQNEITREALVAGKILLAETPTALGETWGVWWDAWRNSPQASSAEGDPN